MADVFVIMPFGSKPIGLGTSELFNFDSVYKLLILPACAKAGYPASRIDELHFSGVISTQIIRKLSLSDIVIADITGSNANVFFELGLRQALTARPTIMIAHRGSAIPFDVLDQRVHFYDALTPDNTNQQVAELSRLVTTVENSGIRSPVIERLQELGLRADPRHRSDFEADLRQKLDRARTLDQLTALWSWCAEATPLPPSLLLDMGDKIASLNGWNVAVSIARRAAVEKPDDFEIYRKLGWYLRNLGPSHYSAAEEAFRKALELNPVDPETLGLLGGLKKRLGKYREAAELYGLGKKYSPDSPYMQVTEAAMLLLSEVSEKREPKEGISAYLRCIVA